MRAICLLEANYNWLNKLAFAKQMMKRAREEGIIPLEQISKVEIQVVEGILATGIFSDITRILHVTEKVESVSLSNCYDTVAHPVASIVVQSFKVQATVVAIMLSILQTMNFYFCTAFG